MEHAPFKFLDSYTREDRAIFFGRDREVEELYQKVFEGKILLLYGISGTGKTSLINCGLANKFEESDWLPINVRRGKDINISLREEIGKVSITKSKEGSTIRKVIQSVYLDYFKPVYLIFDQFEELFIFGDRQEREELIRTIKSLVDSNVQCRCLFSIREEYLAGVTEFESTIPDFLANRMRIEKMTRQNAREVIEGPCRVNGIKVEEGFPEELLEKLNPESKEIELTYLQVFLDRIFRLSGTGNNFSKALIGEAGDVSDLLGSFLEEQIGALEEPETGLTVLKAFVSMQGTKKQIGEEEIGDFARTLGTPVGPEELTGLLQKFVNLRVLKDKDEHDQYELRHDSLAIKIFEKITLVEKELLEIKDFLVNAHSNFERRGIYMNEQDLKYIAPYEDKIFISRKLHQFVTDSKREIQKSVRRRRTLIAAAAAVLIIILSIFTGWAMRERGKAVVQSSIADEQRREAVEARDQAIQARTEANRAKEEAERSEGEALLQKSLADSALSVARYQSRISEEQRQRAESLYTEANEQRQIAVESQQLAEQSADEVKRTNRQATYQLYRFNAKEFAGKSLLMQRNDTLKALLALMAFDLFQYGIEHFSEFVEDPVLDIEIKEALQKSLLAFESDILSESNILALDIRENFYASYSLDDTLAVGEFITTEPDRLPLMGSRYKMAADMSTSRSIIRHIRLRPDDQSLVYGNSGGDVGLINYMDGGWHNDILYRHPESVLNLTILPGEQLILSAGRDSSIIIYHSGSGSVLSRIRAPFYPGEAVSRKDMVMLLSDETGVIYELDLASSKPELREAFNLQHPVDEMGYSPQKALLSITNNEMLRFYRYRSGQDPILLGELNLPHNGIISELCLSPEGDWLSVCSLDGTISLWDLSNLQAIRDRTLQPVVISKTGLKIVHMQFDDSGDHIVYGDMRKTFIYPVSVQLVLQKLDSKMGPRNLSEEEWSNYIRGDIERPGMNNSQ